MMRRSPSLLAGGLIVTLLMIAAAFGPLAIRVDPLSINLGLSLAGPSARHWLGCDSLGRDLLARVLWGARLSLAVSTTVVMLSLGAGRLIRGGGAPGRRPHRWTSDARGGYRARVPRLSTRDRSGGDPRSRPCRSRGRADGDGLDR